ncbi:MAG: UDP-4-amino-4-deoxy-L-arabinose--oxoglutarate aminotransferase [candidate division TA06 bacterium ADurb.Bin417]|uniref:UDP-4-amino-4-deoxy-L-arabinose--oxoglutarate aminotransferase n=1 Tax=candidate division TA06 bacterium ADurb.Bin417 TaxID=1852828 RepID=A0A1V5MJ28_UNCT6|nr:MAG: UDP-4-amino-4-deoxy-L-arabinose--oxoglutarate aminotransferase [candidate division TA06 bacterium ADurb.Bin417]
MPGIEVFDQREEELVLDIIRRRMIYRYTYNDTNYQQSYCYRFETAFNQYLGSRYSLAVSSGTAALRCALAALGVKPGDEVIVPAYTFIATLEAVLDAGAKPVLAEINDTLNLDPAALEALVTPRTVGIIPVHMLGAAAEMKEILAFARGRKLFVLEDACQAVGARYGGQAVGTLAEMGTFSFDSVKLLTCCEGGLVVTKDPEFYRRADRYHDHGHIHNLSLPRGREPKEGAGFNYRISEIHAAIGLAQLQKLPDMLENLHRNKNRIKNGLKLPEGFSFRRLADPHDNATFLAVLAPDGTRAEAVRKEMAKGGVAPAVLNYWHFEVNRELAGGSYPKTEALLDRAIVLPINVRMEPVQLEKIGAVFQAALDTVG